MSADGTPLPYLEVNDADELRIAPDSFSAIRVVLAAIDGDDAALFDVLRDRPALPLLSGLISLLIAVGERAYGDQLRRHLDMLALTEPDGDPYGAAEAYRHSRRSS